jgi:hypothetical protein
MTPVLSRVALLACLVSTPACVISDGGDDDGAGTDDPSASASASSDSADESGDDSGADVTPAEGLWQYEETAGATNDCTFLADPSNGFGLFQIALTGPDSLTLTPGDETEPFECTFGDGAFDCAERFTGMTDEVAGLDAVGNIRVSVEGTLTRATTLDGVQNGRIECEGADCALAAGALGVAFPCGFSVPFVGTAL